jgi:hypothetical protein
MRFDRTLRLVAGGLALLAVASLAIGTRAHAQPGRSSQPIERRVLVDGDSVQLGRPLGALDRWVAVKGDTLVRVPPDRFDEPADGLLVVRDPLGPVRRFAFLYLESRNIDALVGAHMRDFGRTPHYASNPVPEGIQESWTWSDGATALTLTRFTPAQHGVAALRIVTDLAAPPSGRPDPAPSRPTPSSR